MSNRVDRDNVAQLAGVSSATVSRVFNHPDKVSKEKRDKVLKAAEQLHYIPNLNASKLARGINGRILLLDNNKLLRYDSANSHYYSWLYVDLLNQIRSALKNTVYELVISDLEDLKIKEPESLKDYDGIICFDIDNIDDLKIIIESGIPFVFGHHVRDIALPNRIYTDNHYGGYIQARFLRETGHRNAIYVTGLMNQLNAHKERFEGFNEIFNGENLYLINGAVGKDGGSESIKTAITLIKSGQCKAVAAVNDLTAIGIYFELINQGIKIPEDVSVIGYDNLPFTSLLPLKLSTVDIKIGKLYKKAAEHMLNILDGSHREIQSSFKPVLVRGQTVLKRD